MSELMLSLLSDMYGKAKALVRVNDVCSDKFRCIVGVRQGCPLSPILFCLYISDLLPHISESVEGVRIHSTSVNGLLYADDAVLLAENHHNMSLTIDFRRLLSEMEFKGQSI